jgi:hypothetical protein
VAYYAGGYYYAAKRQRLERVRYSEPVLAIAAPNQADKNPAEAHAWQQVPPQVGANGRRAR